MEPSNVHIRLADITDAGRINDLLQRAAPQYVRDDAFWIWIHRLLGCAPSIITVAIVGDKIVGHYAIIPMEVMIDGNVYPAGLGIHALVDKQCKGVSIIDISRLAYDEARKRGMKFIYGFPNKNYRLIQERIERWKKVALFNSYEIATEPGIDFPTDFSWESVADNFDYDLFFALGQLLESGIKNEHYRIKKDILYYYFRYIHHPQNLYLTFFLFRKNTIVGCLFLKKFVSENEITRLHLVDFLRTADLSYGHILQFCKFYASRIEADTISIWPVNIEFRNELQKQGFEPVGFDTFFGIKVLDSDIIKHDIYNFENWELMMGDSDAI